MSTHLPPLPRDIGTVNWIGLWTLYQREVYRFLKVYTQTIAAPVVTTLLFYAVFALALGGVVRMAGSVPFLVFLGPGLIVMAMAQNAFANTSSSVVIAKVQGNIVDVLMPPLSPLEMAVAYVGGGVTRGMFVGVVTGIAIWAFVPLGIHSPAYILFHGLMASMMLAQLGMIGGIWSEKFDHIAAFTNFVVTPLTFLSGTFYSVDRLPPTFWWLAHFNPFFYMIDGFRYGFIGQSDGTLAIGVAVMLGINAALGVLLLRMLSSGYKLKA
ncbi:ABC-2 type transport system permease protein [Skermanella aerolata]|uniref:Transport permease protein n=1 Tax=Skermanella aerolata TaxID=393310 RepID=A0A512DWN2_9PROT|nr:ABC transporter permease [Skermanella aerolata]KJB93686.1 multidrug ABC transporter permease [Skermanella aerolata KACC 11604]GEO40884.1 transport permease protein [Skermanella aerolata]